GVVERERPARQLVRDPRHDPLVQLAVAVVVARERVRRRRERPGVQYDERRERGRGAARHRGGGGGEGSGGCPSRASSLSIIAAKSFRRVTRLPFRNTVGVPLTPAAVPSRSCARSFSVLAGRSMQAPNAATSRPASAAAFCASARVFSWPCLGKTAS